MAIFNSYVKLPEGNIHIYIYIYIHTHLFGEMDVGVPILGDTQDFEIYVSAYSVENGWLLGVAGMMTLRM